mmetsp:Transcript_37888/g.67912  ORF Transcript_37888/g.67912 Transcript_37888/m.67912 type:complete len:445 (+) Transcript_37888:51-1385(+)
MAVTRSLAMHSAKLALLLCLVAHQRCTGSAAPDSCIGEACADMSSDSSILMQAKVRVNTQDGADTKVKAKIMKNPSAGTESVNRTNFAAVTYLVKHDLNSLLLDLSSSLTSLNENFCKQMDMGSYYPVLLFSEFWHEYEQEPLKNAAKNCQLRFETLPSSFWEMPDFIPSKVTDDFAKYHSGGRGLGYGLMIRWNMRTLFEHPAIQSLQFILRMDTDSRILSPLSFDPLMVMYTERPRKRYAYHCGSFENPEFSEGMNDFVAKYMREKQVVSPWENFHPARGYPVAMPYNNIEIVDVEWWRSQPVQQYVDAVDRSLNIWYHRWGDAPIRGMAISLFLHEDELLHLDDFRYSHPADWELEPDKFRQASRFEEFAAWIRNPTDYRHTFFGLCREKHAVTRRVGLFDASNRSQNNFKYPRPAERFGDSRAQGLDLFAKQSEGLLRRL